MSYNCTSQKISVNYYKGAKHIDYNVYILSLKLPKRSCHSFRVRLVDLHGEELNSLRFCYMENFSMENKSSAREVFLELPICTIKVILNGKGVN